MYQTYKADVEVFLVYIHEAHPSDQKGTTGKSGGKFKQATTDEERRDTAGLCVKNLKLAMPTLIDGMDNKVEKDYASFPDRIYVIGKDGKVAYKGAKGPFGFKPGEAEDAIKKILGK